MEAKALKVGDLARRTGLTVRTLHYYEEIGLLSPSNRTEAGHRLYEAGDIARLQQVRSLRQLGFGLDEIRQCLNSVEFSPQRVIRLHKARIQEQIELQQKLYQRLEAIESGLDASGELSIEKFIQAIEVTSMLDNVFEFSPEEIEQIQEQGRKYGEEGIRQVEAEWPQLIARAQAEMEKGADPSDEAMQGIARRWLELVKGFTGGNPEIERKMRERYQADTSVQQQMGINPDLMGYVWKAIGLINQEK